MPDPLTITIDKQRIFVNIPEDVDVRGKVATDWPQNRMPTSLRDAQAMVKDYPGYELWDYQEWKPVPPLRGTTQDVRRIAPMPEGPVSPHKKGFQLPDIDFGILKWVIIGGFGLLIAWQLARRD